MASPVMRVSLLISGNRQPASGSCLPPNANLLLSRSLPGAEDLIDLVAHLGAPIPAALTPRYNHRSSTRFLLITIGRIYVNSSCIPSGGALVYT